MKNISQKKRKGFTLIELMVVIVIIGILVSIALPNFVAAQDRARIAALKTNMHSFQTAVEMYAIDWDGMYAPDGVSLKNEGTIRKYWKPMINPFTSQIDFGTSIITSVASNGDITPATFPAGNLAYVSTIISYGIYGGDKVQGKAVLYSGKSFELTNH